MNLSGLYDSKPTVLYKDEEYYSSKDGNICIDLKARKQSEGHIDFYSDDEDEVKLWLDGANAVMRLLQNWSKTAEERVKK